MFKSSKSKVCKKAFGLQAPLNRNRHLLTSSEYNAASITHTNVIKIINMTFQMVHDMPCFVAVMPLYDTTLWRYLRENKVIRDKRRSVLMVTKLIDAVKFIHDSGFAHLDIKPSNVLINIDKKSCGFANEKSSQKPKLSKQFVSELTVQSAAMNWRRRILYFLNLSTHISREWNLSDLVITDFGIGGQLSGLNRRGCGTPGFASPEQIVKKPDEMSDIYSLGRTFVLVFFGWNYGWNFLAKPETECGRAKLISCHLFDRISCFLVNMLYTDTAKRRTIGKCKTEWNNMIKEFTVVNIKELDFMLKTELTSQSWEFVGERTQARYI